MLSHKNVYNMDKYPPRDTIDKVYHFSVFSNFFSSVSLLLFNSSPWSATRIDETLVTRPLFCSESCRKLIFALLHGHQIVYDELYFLINKTQCAEIQGTTAN